MNPVKERLDILPNVSIILHFSMCESLSLDGARVRFLKHLFIRKNMIPVDISWAVEKGNHIKAEALVSFYTFFFLTRNLAHGLAPRVS